MILWYAKALLHILQRAFESLIVWSNLYLLWDR